jgi:hypothetical protein
MIVTTIGAILNGTFDHPAEHDIYIISDPGGVLYVGITRTHIYKRLSGHIRAGSLVGDAITDYAPESHNWTVELRTPADVVPGLDLLSAEAYLIRSLQPFLNGTHRAG